MDRKKPTPPLPDQLNRLRTEADELLANAYFDKSNGFNNLLLAIHYELRIIGMTLEEHVRLSTPHQVSLLTGHIDLSPEAVTEALKRSEGWPTREGVQK